MSSTPAEQVETPRPPPPARPVLEVLAAAATATLLFSAFLVLPVAGPMALPFAAVPAVRMAHRRGAAIGLLTATLAAGVVFLLGWVSGGAAEAVDGGLLAEVLIGLPALCSGAVRRGWSPSRAYLALCVIGLALAGAAVLARSHDADATMSREIDRGFDEWVRLSTQSTRTQVDSETAVRVRATLEAARGFCKRFWMGLIGASWTLGAAVSFFAGAWSGRPAPSALAARFESLRIPAPVAALFVASGAGWVLGGPAFSRVAGNLLWPLLALYFVAGLSIICHFARKWFRSRVLRIGLYALAIYVVPLNVGVALLGLFDWYADFRRRGREIRES